MKCDLGKSYTWEASFIAFIYIRIETNAFVKCFDSLLFFTFLNSRIVI